MYVTLWIHFVHYFLNAVVYDAIMAIFYFFFFNFCSFRESMQLEPNHPGTWNLVHGVFVSS